MEPNLEALLFASLAFPMVRSLVPLLAGKLDLRTHLQAPPSAPEGIDLLALCQKLLTNAIRPVLKEVNITGALGHQLLPLCTLAPVKGRCIQINQ